MQSDRAVNGVRFARVSLACRDIFEKSLGGSRGDFVAREFMRMVDHDRAVSTARDHAAASARLAEWASLGLTSAEQAMLLIDDQVTRCKRYIGTSGSTSETLRVADLVKSLEAAIDYAIEHLSPRVKPRNGAKGSTIAELMAGRSNGDDG